MPYRSPSGAVDLHEKTKDIPAFSAAKAVEHLPRRADRERRRFLRMKRAKSLVVLTGLAEGEVRADDFDNVGALPYPLDDIFRDQPFIHECPAGVRIFLVSQRNNPSW